MPENKFTMAKDRSHVSRLQPIVTRTWSEGALLRKSKEVFTVRRLVAYVRGLMYII